MLKDQRQRRKFKLIKIQSPLECVLRLKPNALPVVHVSGPNHGVALQWGVTREQAVAHAAHSPRGGMLPECWVIQHLIIQFGSHRCTSPTPSSWLHSNSSLQCETPTNGTVCEFWWLRLSFMLVFKNKQHIFLSEVQWLCRWLCQYFHYANYSSLD